MAKNAPDSDDLEDDVEIKGPTFQFNKPIQDSVFKLTSNSADNTSKLDEKKEEEVKSTPLFGATTQDKDQATTLTGLFGFGQNKGGETKAPSLFGGSFGSNGNTTEQKPVSTFSLEILKIKQTLLQIPKQKDRNSIIFIRYNKFFFQAIIWISE